MNVKQLIKEKFLPIQSNQYAGKIYANLLLNNSISRAAVGAVARVIDPLKPESWEFSGFSQNGEDGIIDYLINGLKENKKYFVEIGSGNGLENNTSYLAHIKKFSGLQVEGDKHAYNQALLIKPWLVQNLNCFLDVTSIQKVIDEILYKDPEVFSIDIDGMDYYILKELLEKGVQPKIIIVEYNSAYGPDNLLTIPYDANFSMYKTGYPYLYYGVSLKGWEKLLTEFGFTLLTVETNGVNAFFIQTEQFKAGLLENLESLCFRENVHQFRLFRKNWEGQFEMIKDLPFSHI